MEDTTNVSLIKLIQTTWCMLEVFCFGGLQYGWAPLVYMYKQEGFFNESCQKFNETETLRETTECTDQDKQLSLLYSLANGLSIIPMFLCGTSLSRYGAVKTRVIYTIVFICGCGMMVAASRDYPWFACAGIMLLAGGGRVFLLTNIQISRLYTTGSFIVVTLLAGCFDSSSAIAFFIKLVYERGISMRISFAAIMCLSLSAFVHTYFTFHRTQQLCLQKDIANDDSIPEKDDKKHSSTTDVTEPITLRQLCKTYVCNHLYISLFIWFTLIAGHFMFFISTSNLYIQDIVHVVDGTDESSLTNFLSISLLAGIVPALFVGMFLELYQLKTTGSLYISNLKTSVIGFVMTNLLSVTMAILSIFHIEALVYLVFSFMAILRAFLFAGTSSFIAKAFPERAFGVLSAFIDVQASLILLFQRALVQWLKAYDDAKLHIRICFIIVSLIAMYHPIVVHMKTRNTEKLTRCTEEQDSEDRPNFDEEGTKSTLSVTKT